MASGAAWAGLDAIRDFHQHEKSIADVLTALVLAANPDKDVKQAAEPNQKLVWAESSVPIPRIVVTTREGAKKSGLVLPPAFVAK